MLGWHPVGMAPGMAGPPVHSDG